MFRRPLTLLVLCWSTTVLWNICSVWMGVHIQNAEWTMVGWLLFALLKVEVAWELALIQVLHAHTTLLSAFCKQKSRWYHPALVVLEITLSFHSFRNTWEQPAVILVSCTYFSLWYSSTVRKGQVTNSIHVVKLPARLASAHGHKHPSSLFSSNQLYFSRLYMFAQKEKGKICLSPHTVILRSSTFHSSGRRSMSLLV